MDTSQDAPPRPMVLFVVIFAMMDFFIPSMIYGPRSEVVEMFFAGLVVGQFGLLSIWAVLAPQPVLVRWPVMLLTAMGLLLILLLGAIAIEGVRTDDGAFLLLFCWLPLIFLAAQSPLWVLRLVTGCRLVEATAEDQRPSEESRQFDLRHMFAVTALIAILLTVARMSFYLTPDSYRVTETEMWLPLLMICAVCAAWSAFATIPCLGAVFVARNPTAGLIGVIVYVSVMTILIVVGMSWLMPGPGASAVFEVILGINVGLAVVLLCSLHLLRAAGFRLLWVRRKSAVVEGGSD